VNSKDHDFTEFASARWLTLVRVGMTLGCSLTEAEDLAQTTLLRAYVAWKRVSKADHRDAYVSKMLVNAHRDSHRKRWRREIPMAEVRDTSEPDTTTEFDTAEVLRRAVASLSLGQREVVALRYFVGLNEPEIAEALGVARGTVKSRLSRALEALSQSPDLARLKEHE